MLYIYIFRHNVSVQPVGCEIPHFVWFNVNSLTPTLHQASRQETSRGSHGWSKGEIDLTVVGQPHVLAEGRIAGFWNFLD